MAPPGEHLLVDGEPVSGALSTSASILPLRARAARRAGRVRYFYLPKMESHSRLGCGTTSSSSPRTRSGSAGDVPATVLTETFPAAFEMEEILYELRDHSGRPHAGCWDYMFSVIKCFRTRGVDFLLPDRNSVTMTVPFMRAYTELSKTNRASRRHKGHSHRSRRVLPSFDVGSAVRLSVVVLVVLVVAALAFASPPSRCPDVVPAGERPGNHPSFGVTACGAQPGTMADGSAWSRGCRRSALRAARRPGRCSTTSRSGSATVPCWRRAA